MQKSGNSARVIVVRRVVNVGHITPFFNMFEGISEARMFAGDRKNPFASPCSPEDKGWTQYVAPGVQVLISQFERIPGQVNCPAHLENSCMCAVPQREAQFVVYSDPSFTILDLVCAPGFVQCEQFFSVQYKPLSPFQCVEVANDFADALPWQLHVTHMNFITHMLYVSVSWNYMKPNLLFTPL